MSPAGDNFRILSGETAWTSFMAWYLATFHRTAPLRNVLPIRPGREG